MKNNKTTFATEPGKQEMLISRAFDAPRELVFKAFTDPKLYIQWLGPRQLTMTLETFEPRIGGMWRYIHKEQNGNEYAFHGVYHEVTAPRELSTHSNLMGFRKKGMSFSKRRDLKYCQVTGQS